MVVVGRCAEQRRLESLNLKLGRHGGCRSCHVGGRKTGLRLLKRARSPAILPCLCLSPSLVMALSQLYIQHYHTLKFLAYLLAVAAS